MSNYMTQIDLISFLHVHRDGKHFGLVTVTTTSAKALDLLAVVFQTIGESLAMAHIYDSFIFQAAASDKMWSRPLLRRH